MIQIFLRAPASSESGLLTLSFVFSFVWLLERFTESRNGLGWKGLPKIIWFQPLFTRQFLCCASLRLFNILFFLPCLLRSGHYFENVADSFILQKRACSFTDLCNVIQYFLTLRSLSVQLDKLWCYHISYNIVSFSLISKLGLPT